MTNANVTIADLDSIDDQTAILAMMDAYSADPMGDGEPLSAYSRESLIDGLRNHPTTLVFLARMNDSPSGIATCFGGFSTFAARPLLNISDFYVDPALRGRGIGGVLLRAIEREANSRGCCKITLEVQENNNIARTIYEKFGFSQAVYVADAGGSLCLSKPLTQNVG